MWTAKFWRETAERAVKSAAQAVVGIWAMDGFNIVNADFGLAAGVAGGAAALSVLTSILTAGVGEANSPSAVEK
jgi:hypothetical protein